MRLKGLNIIAAAAMLLCALSTSAQPGGGGGGMGGGMGGPGGGMGGPGGGMDMESIDPVAMCGIFDIDSKMVVKKTKVKDKEVQNKIHRAVAQYLLDLDEVKVLYADQIKQMSTRPERSGGGERGSMGGGMGGGMERGGSSMGGGESEESGSSNSMRDMMKQRREQTAQLRSATEKVHKALDAQMKELLDGKEEDRWVSYYKKVCSDNLYSQQRPQRPQRSEGGEGERAPRE